MFRLRYSLDRMRNRLFVHMPGRAPTRLRWLQVAFVVLLSALVLTSTLSNWPQYIPTAHAAPSPPPAKGITNYKQFVQLGRDSTYHGPLKQRLTAAPTPCSAASRSKVQPKAKL